MSQKWTIRFAAMLTILTVGAHTAHCQVRPVVFPYFPVSPYGGGLGGYGYPGIGYGGLGGYGYPGIGYSGYGGYSGFGGGVGYSGYGESVYTPAAYSGWSGYSAPVVIIATATSSGVRANLSPAMAIRPDSPLLLAGWDVPAGDNRAVVVIVVPDANARVWVQGTLTQQTGLIRRFTSPVLTPGKTYEYDIYAQWTQADGKLSAEPTRTVQVNAGAVVNVLFAKKTP